MQETEEMMAMKESNTLINWPVGREFSGSDRVRRSMAPSAML